MKYKARVKEKFVCRKGKLQRVYRKGEILEGELDQTGPVKKFVCRSGSFPLSRFDKLTAVVEEPGMTVEELSSMMNSPAEMRKLMGIR